jgi:signal peptidase I
MNKIVGYLKSFWKFLKKDSWASFAITLLLAFVIIKFIFFPGLSLITGTSLPLVIVESCSMYHHDNGFENTFESDVYSDYGLSLDDTSNWIFQNGFSKGDVIFVVAAKNIEVGDVIIFNAGAQYPLIHRVVGADDSYSTKGDNYKTNDKQLNGEKSISEEQLIGKALFKVPFIGWTKLIFFERGRDPRERGFC